MEVMLKNLMGAFSPWDPIDINDIYDTSDRYVLTNLFHQITITVSNEESFINIIFQTTFSITFHSYHNPTDFFLIEISE